MPVAPEAIPKTAVTKPFGLFELIRMPFSLVNATQTFQRLLTKSYRLTCSYAYLDDILAASRDADEHLDHLRQHFTLLRDHSIQISPAKCILGVDSLEFLGHQVDKDGIHPQEERIQVIRDYPQPAT